MGLRPFVEANELRPIPGSPKIVKSLTKTQIKSFQARIWKFYKEKGRKMPWRGEKDPYRVLVSEIMLQQTQVSRVLPKYTEFLTAFPTVHSLARSPLSRVLRVWSGLGYNRRAKFLWLLSQEVVKKHSGKIPKDPKILLTLPGIGKGTVGSFLAFAHNKQVVFIETNIRRVFIHHFFPKRNLVSDVEILKIVEQALPKNFYPVRNRAAKTVVSSFGAREWYYALMDYGSTLKVKENPNRRSRHYAKQSKFKGSKREVRGFIIKKLVLDGWLKMEMFEKESGFDSKIVSQVIRELEKERFLEIRRGFMRLK